jgi:glutathione synthase/RimK-type ligase-like ATP-grasp enzyme
MTKTLLFFTPAPESRSFEGRWRDVLAAYRNALAGTDIEVHDAAWTAPLTRAYDLVTPLLAWGYHLRPEDFAAVLEDLNVAGVRLRNPAEIVTWNIDKRYLRDLAEAGMRIVPTQFVERVTEAAIAQARADFSDTLVIKPVFSAGAKNTVVWSGTNVPPDGPEGLAMIQPFLPAIRSEGEWSLLFYGGRFSHAILKTPKAEDFRSQPDYGAHLRALPPPSEARELAEAAIAYVGADKLLYARVDMVRDADGRFCLMELELIEPDLYLTYDDQAPARLVEAFKAALD